GEAPALILVKQPRERERSDRTRDRVQPSRRSGTQKMREECDAHSGQDIVDDGDHARRRTEEREYGAKVERGWFHLRPTAGSARKMKFRERTESAVVRSDAGYVFQTLHALQRRFDEPYDGEDTEQEYHRKHDREERDQHVGRTGHETDRDQRARKH